MKTDIHPKYFPEAKITCACGASFTIGSTKEKLQVEICSQCHPFYTGEEKVIDTAGRVERFKTKRTIAEKKQATIKERDAQRKKREKEREKKENAKEKTAAKKQAVSAKTEKSPSKR